jgi:hypothetical protein
MSMPILFPSRSPKQVGMGTSGFTEKSRTTSTWWTRSFEFDTKLAPAALFWLGILLARSWNAAWSHRRDALALAGLHRAGYEAF